MQVVVIFGSNSGNKRRTIEEATTLLSERVGAIVIKSSFYETEPWGFECTELFLNQVVIFESTLAPEDILQACLETEKRLGRIRPAGIRYASRTIDIDILFCGQQVISTTQLTVPHPRLELRNFVLTPLNEIIPDFIHPVLHKKISGLLTECPDKMAVRKL